MISCIVLRVSNALLKTFDIGCHGQALLVRAYCKTQVNKFTRATQMQYYIGFSTEQVSSKTEPHAEFIPTCRELAR